ncbi:DUF4160 domain-containing protein [uncultured Campylobacter sp.]|uniref:type II toxin-antitoxin system toxin DhiT n=1 Tax=uncultured Campylobacter sp. TaxID=218934 RepID=UPI00261A4D85|nr:DUF4160 domain-containing protein [uncultured Campylobacter sp.]
MPVIARFYGIIIKMFFASKEHNPPHIHALYNEYSGVFSIETIEMIEGDLPNKAKKMVEEWMTEHKDELMQMWQSQIFKELKPLE